MTGQPVSSAIRAAPVLARIGHPFGSLVIVPSGYTPTQPPARTEVQAASKAFAASVVSRDTGIIRASRTMCFTIGTSKSASLARYCTRRPCS
jgi:hypothetical protein